MNNKKNLNLIRNAVVGSALSLLPHISHAQYMAAPMTGVSAAPIMPASTGVMALPVNVSTIGGSAAANYLASAPAAATIPMYQSNANNTSTAIMQSMNATSSMNNAMIGLQAQMNAAPLSPSLGGMAFGSASFAPTLAGYTRDMSLNLGSQLAGINTSYSNNYGAISNTFWNQYNSILPTYANMLGAENRGWEGLASSTRNAVLNGTDRLPAGGLGFNAAQNFVLGGAYGFSGMGAGSMDGAGNIAGGSLAARVAPTAYAAGNPWAPQVQASVSVDGQVISTPGGKPFGSANTFAEALLTTGNNIQVTGDGRWSLTYPNMRMNFNGFNGVYTPEAMLNGAEVNSNMFANFNLNRQVPVNVISSENLSLPSSGKAAFGYYTPWTNTVTVPQNFNTSTLYHELGHAVENQVINKSPGQAAQLSAGYLTSLANPAYYSSENPTGYSYAQSSPSEHFAESVATYFDPTGLGATNFHRGNVETSADLQIQNPATYSLLKGIFH